MKPRVVYGYLDDFFYSNNLESLREKKKPSALSILTGSL